MILPCLDEYDLVLVNTPAQDYEVLPDNAVQVQIHMIHLLGL